MVILGLQLSLAVGESKLHGIPHSALLLVAQTMIGGVVSITVTVWLQLTELPHPSAALQVRVALKAPPQAPLLFVTVLMI